jgi:two-component system response regulator AtoC
MERPLALVLDRDPAIRRRAKTLLSEAGVEAVEAGSGPEALEVLRTRPIRIALVDLDAPGVATTDFLGRATRARPALVPVVLTAEAGSAEALRLLHGEAHDVLDRGLEAAAVQVAAVRALGQNRLLEDLVRLRDRLRGRSGYRKIVGRSAVMEQLRERLDRQSTLDAPVLLIGEEGSGKELAARTIHEMSARGEAPFLTVDCGSLPEPTLESEIFGHGQGAHAPGTGRPSVGVLESADGGSVFLREVIALPDRLQVRLQEALAEGAFNRIDGTRRVPLNVRLFSSSSRDVDAAVREGRFGEDLRARLAVSVLQVSSLRERKEDVALLARQFIETICEINDLPTVHLSPETLQMLEAYAWPGNVRELRNAMEQAVILSTDRTIRPRDLPQAIQRVQIAGVAEAEDLSDRPFRVAKREVVDAFERSYLSELLMKHGGNVTAAAQQAGMLRSALQRLLRKHELRSADFRRGTRARASRES